MKLNVGGFQGIENFKSCGWVCVDKDVNSEVSINLEEDILPFDDNSIEAIYTSHTLEHIFPDKLPFVLSEFYRVLSPSGLIRIVVPDMEIAINAYINGNTEFLSNTDVTVRTNHTRISFPPLPLYQMISWFYTYYVEDNVRKFTHVNGFDKKTIKFFLESIGFINVSNMKFNKCSTIFNECDLESHKLCSLYVEAIKNN